LWRVAGLAVRFAKKKKKKKKKKSHKIAHCPTKRMDRRYK